MTTKPSHELQNINLDRVLMALEHWRKNKKDYNSTGIPNDIWLMIFALEDTKTFNPATLRKVLTLNTKQYNEKRCKLVEQKSQANQEHAIMADEQEAELLNDCVFHEISPLELNTSDSDLLLQAKKDKITNLTSKEEKPEEYLDQNTIIVECFHPKGYRLKIHTTNKHIHTIIREFIDNAVMPC